jgi:cyanate lyase
MELLRALCLAFLTLAQVPSYSSAFVVHDHRVVSARSSSQHLSPRYAHPNAAHVADRVERVVAAKSASGLSYDQLASELGVTNAYAAQLVLGQAKLSPELAIKLKKAIPALSDQDIEDMQNHFPMRCFDDDILKEPNVYRTYEAITHYGMAIKTLINEQCGDGIMSAIDFYLDVGTTTGKSGEKRVVITFNGKFLPFLEQLSENNTAKSPRD